MNLETVLKEKGIPFEKHTHPRAYTAQELAQAEHVTGFMVAKPVVVRAGDEFLMCVVAAPKHVDLERVGEVIGRPDVRLATEIELTRVCPDCEVGAEPPVGTLFGMRTIVDIGLEPDEHLIMQAGKHTDSIKMRREDWERVCEPTRARIAGGG
jgi:Ala-tRNA(Pro) deacylase